MSPTLLLYVGAGALLVGIAAIMVIMLSGNAQLSGVAKSLALIEHGFRPQEVAKSELGIGDRLVQPLLDFTRRLARSVAPRGATARLTRLLDVAGNPPTWTVERLMGVKGAAMLLLGALGFLLFGGLSVKGILLAVVLGAAGFFLPDLLIYNAGIKRQDQLRKGLADALDMLTVCVEAGQSFDGALQQVSRSVTGPVAGEFSRVLQEIQIGRPRGQAFASMSDRTSVPEVKTFVTALVQADRLGLPIGAVLREQAHQMRLVRRQRAEEQAQKVTVKILFPLLLCIFPAIFVVIIGPGAIRIMDTFSHM